MKTFTVFEMWPFALAADSVVCVPCNQEPVGNPVQLGAFVELAEAGVLRQLEALKEVGNSLPASARKSFSQILLWFSFFYISS